MPVIARSKFIQFRATRSMIDNRKPLPSSTAVEATVLRNSMPPALDIHPRPENRTRERPSADSKVDSRSAAAQTSGPANTSPTKHDQVRKLEVIAREGIASIKQTDAAKGCSLSNVATVVAQQVDIDALRGKKVVDDARRGHERVHGTDEAKSHRWAKHQAEVDRLRIAHPDWSKSNVAREAARNTGCNEKTIRRHCRVPGKNS